MNKVKELMVTSIKACKKDEPITKVSGIMDESNIGFLPVVDDGQKVIGTITDRDIALTIGKSKNQMKELKVEEVMNTRVHTVNTDDDISNALKLMRTQKIGRLPVVDNERKLKGVINLSRIMRHANADGSSMGEDGKTEVMDTVNSIAERNKTKKTSR